MTRDKLIKEVSKAFEMEISIGEKKYTIEDENEKGFSITEWYKEDEIEYFDDAESLVNGYMVDGKALSDYSDVIKIEFYAGM